jgi:hypothetical protein
MPTLFPYTTLFRSISVLDGLDGWDVVIVQDFLFLRVVVVVVVILDLSVDVLVQPRESNEVDDCDSDPPLVE